MSTYYINADSGSDLGTGTIGDPWLTLAYAYDNSTTNDTIVCQDSTATYDFVTDELGGRTIQGEQDDGSGAVFDGGNINSYWLFSADSTVEKITIKNAIVTGTNRCLLESATNSITITLNNLVIYDIGLNASAGNAAIIGDANVHTYVIFNVNNCLIYNITASTAEAGIFGIRQTTNVTINVINSTTYTNDSLVHCIRYHYASTVQFVHKNSIHYTEVSTSFGYGLGTAPTPTVTYSDLYNYTSAPTGNGVITSDPLFVDISNNNFNLRPSSPCIGTGTLV